MAQEHNLGENRVLSIRARESGQMLKRAYKNGDSQIMGCMSVGASRKLRWGCVSLAAIVAFCAVIANPADARGRKRHFVKRTGMSASASYSPAYAAIVVDAK